MMICVAGRTGLSWRTHSTPLSPGRLISIKTTCGTVFGSSRKALSALGCWLKQRKPGEPSINCARLARTDESSSTIETEMLTENKYRDRLSRRFVLIVGGAYCCYDPY